MKNSRVLVVDDIELIRYAICRLIDLAKGMMVIAEAGNGEDGIKLAEKHKPDLIVMDVRLPDLSGFEATTQILAKAPDTRVIAVSSYEEEDLAICMFRAGVLGYLLKDDVRKELVAALRCVAAGDYYLSNRFGKGILRKIMMDTGLKRSGRRPRPLLTRRQRQVLHLVEDGMTSKEISSKLSISVETVRTHRRNALHATRSFKE